MTPSELFSIIKDVYKNSTCPKDGTIDDCNKPCPEFFRERCSYNHGQDGLCLILFDLIKEEVEDILYGKAQS